MKTLNIWLGAGTLFLLSGCLSEIPTKELDGSASNPVAASQRQSLGLGTIATYDYTSLPALTATGFIGSLTGQVSTATQNSITSVPNLATVGTITSGTWQGTQIADTYLATISTAGKVSNAATTATSANTNSAIVARDASGNFSAGTISAALNGQVSAATQSSITSIPNLATVGTITSGTWQGTQIADTYLATISTVGKVSNAATTATSANTASAIVARDASGNFSAGTISATGLSVSGFLRTTCASVTVDGSNTVLGDVSGEQASCVIVSGTGAQTFTLSNGTASGTRLTLIAASGATTSLNLANSAASPGPFLTTATAWTPSENDTLELLWTGDRWVELGRSDN